MKGFLLKILDWDILITAQCPSPPPQHKNALKTVFSLKRPNFQLKIWKLAYV